MSAELARQLANMGIRDGRVLDAIARVPRRLFVGPELQEVADADRPLPIGFGQTISQPYIVGFMTEWLRLHGPERVLEIGTGSGYQTAILALLAREVFTVELVPELADRAARTLAALELVNVRCRVGDGRAGWPEEAPFDRVIVTAAADALPEPLVQQLAPGGRLLAPVGIGDAQELRLVTRDADGHLDSSAILPVRFVPLMRGAAPSA